VELAASEPGAVRIETAVPSGRLIELLRESYGYVHGAGAFVKESESPEKCEHFGLAIAEAMACGCIPLVFHGGGIFDVLKIGSGGLSYLTFAGLVAGFNRLADLYGTEEGRRKQQWNRNAARELSQDGFTRKLGRILKEVEAP
jgi:glycosyltransferase involved in cell wall biosynthesis